jgi:hypothetical protein
VLALAPRRDRSLFVACALALVACVPEGPPTGAAGTSKALAHAAPRSSAALKSAMHPLLVQPFFDDFDRPELGPNYTALSASWRIEDGRLCVQGAKNKGVWLAKRIPTNARIEFDAIAESNDGDLKAEVWGDGASGATSSSYSNATSYLTILGGWRNTKHVLARLDEHGVDRLEIDVDPNSDDERERAVSPGQPYHFKIERADGKNVAWSVNGVTYLEMTDAEPLVGVGHDHVGFNDWDARVCFDNLRVTPL